MMEQEKVRWPGMITEPACDMKRDCREEVAMIDQSGFVYCAPHGKLRQQGETCRKLRPHEMARLRRGEQIEKY